MDKSKTLSIALAILVAVLGIGWAFREQLAEMQQRAAQHGFKLYVPEFLESSPMSVRHDTDKLRVGQKMKEEGYKPKHPVIIIPGFVTSGLQLWEGHHCAKDFYRKRIWGSLEMGKTALQDLDCWLEHMALHEETGVDPEGIKLRACEGLDAIEFFMPGYAVWGKLTEALSDVGYDTNTLVTETYDWRLAVPLMQKRDNYFTRLKIRVELLHSLHHEKVVIVSHSWGDNVFRNFLVWATEADDQWVSKHISSYINIAGPTLGVPKSISTYLSGETRDTAELGAITGLLSQQVVSAAQRIKTFRTWGAGIGMLPNGGPGIWGNATFAPDDTPGMIKHNVSYGSYITEEQVNQTELEALERKRGSWLNYILPWKPMPASTLTQDIKSHDVTAAVELMLANADKNFKEHVRLWAAVQGDPTSRQCSGDPEKYFFDPLKCPLPNAPSLQLFCLYGVGMPTERSYHYIHRGSENATDGHGERLWSINSDAEDSCDETDFGSLSSGIRVSDGDATVPLISSGTLCRKHWRHEKLNPAGFRVVSREFPQGGRSGQENSTGEAVAADHVTILSNEGVIADVVAVAAGRGGELGDDIYSDIDRIVSRMNIEAE